MDNNSAQQTSAPPVSPAPAGAPAPQTSYVTPAMQPQESRSSGKLIMFFLGGILLIALIVGGVYLYLNKNQVLNMGKAKEKVSSYALPVTKPPASQNENLQEELDSINIATDDSDFTPVDQDLQGL